jgi:hypothetical protein
MDIDRNVNPTISAAQMKIWIKTTFTGLAEGWYEWNGHLEALTCWVGLQESESHKRKIMMQ